MLAIKPTQCTFFLPSLTLGTLLLLPGHFKLLKRYLQLFFFVYPYYLAQPASNKVFNKNTLMTENIYLVAFKFINFSARFLHISLKESLEQC